MPAEAIGVDGYAREQHGGYVGTVVAIGNPVYEQGRQQTTGKGGKRQQEGSDSGYNRIRKTGPEDDHADCREGRAGRDADQRGIGQGIAEQSLQ